MGKQRHFLQGQKFGRWTALERVVTVTPQRNVTKWRCRCECGNEAIMVASILLQGRSTSCGCYRKEWASQNSRTHGLAKTEEYHIWQSMISRCGNPKNKSYHNYGGRGIRVCEKWLSFVVFYQDMGPRPSRKHSLERIDNDGDYEPSNCRWATSIEQSNNRRVNVLYTFRGETDTIRGLYTKYAATGLTFRTVRATLDKKWAIEDALLIPKLRSGVNHKSLSK